MQHQCLHVKVDDDSLQILKLSSYMIWLSLPKFNGSHLEAICFDSLCIAQGCFVHKPRANDHENLRVLKNHPKAATWEVGIQFHNWWILKLYAKWNLTMLRSCNTCLGSGLHHNNRIFLETNGNLIDCRPFSNKSSAIFNRSHNIMHLLHEAHQVDFLHPFQFLWSLRSSRFGVKWPSPTSQPITWFVYQKSRALKL